MVFCCVFNCSNRSENCRKSFFRIPSIIKHDKESELLSQERRSKWFSNIKRVHMDTKANHYRVCSDHFLSGKCSMFPSSETWLWRRGSDGGVAKGLRQGTAIYFFRIRSYGN